MTRRKHGARCWTIGVLLLLSTMLCGAARAGEPIYELDIPSMNAAQALNRFAEQTGAIMLFSYDLANARRTSAVRGRYTLLEGLELLLRGTGLSGGLSDKRVVNISPSGNTQRPGEEKTVPKEKASLRNRIAAFFTSVLAASAASGQDAANATPYLEEIVVTALKRGDQSLIDVPAAISAIQGVDLERRSADSLKDVLQSTPSVTIDESDLGGTQIQIRGVNSRNGSGSVGFYMDGLPFSFINLNTLPDPTPYDLRTVEILRGPQGTLYGAGSAGGVVIVNTNDPVLGRFEGKGDLLASATEDGGTNGSFSGALNVPLSESTTLRGSLSMQENSGWIDDAADPDARDLNDEQRLNARLKFLAQPTDRLSLTLLAVLSRKDRDFALDQSDDAGEVPQSEFTAYETLGIGTDSSEDFNQYGATVNYETAPFEITNTSSFLRYESRLNFGFPTPFPSQYDTDIYTNELRLNSSHGGPLSWVAGFFYRDAEQLLFQEAAALTPLFDADDLTQSKQYSIFGEATLALLDEQLEITAGASSFKDRTKNRGSMAPLVPDPIFQRVETSRFNPQASIAFHPTSRSTIYARYATGFRPGVIDFSLSTFFAQLAVPTVTGVVGPEKIKSFEVGFKGQISASLYTEATLFRNDLSDAQTTSLVQIPGTNIQANTIINAGRARSQGVEWVLGFTPIPALSARLSGSYTDAGLRGDFFAPGSDPATSAPIFFDGDPLYLVPKWSLSADADYSWDVGSTGLTARLFASVQYTSERPRPILLQPTIFGDEVIRADARAELGRDNWTAYIFVDNIGNEDGRITPVPDDLSAFSVSGDFGTRMRPRTIGAGVRFDF